VRAAAKCPSSAHGRFIRLCSIERQIETLAELEKDYLAMRVMFLADPPSFERIAETVRGLENRINQMA